MEEFDDDLEAIFIEETFHSAEPIRSKAVKSDGQLIERVWLRKRKKGSNKRVKLYERFQQLQDLCQQIGMSFEDEDDDNDDQFEDIDRTEDDFNSNSLTTRPRDRKLLLSLANKLKKKSICNRLGIAYNPGKNRLKDARTRLGTSKSWSEKFGRLLAAKKLLYLPLLYRKYRSGPRKSRQELDIEIDLYMADVRKAKCRLKLALGNITNSTNNEDKTTADNDNGSDLNNGIVLLPQKSIFGGFGGPKWKKRLINGKQNIENAKQSLDMDIDSYMKSKDRKSITFKTEYEDKDELDVDLDIYMSQVKNKATKQEVIANSVH